MPEQVRCPSCTAPLRVPDNLLGKNVKCPKCQATFLAEAEEPEQPEEIVQKPQRSSSVRRRPSPPQEEELEEVPDEEDEEVRPQRRGRRRRRTAEAARGVAGPAISLLVVSGLAIGYSILNLVLSLFMGGISASLLSQQEQMIQQQQQQQFRRPAPGGFGMQPIQPPPTAPQPPLSPKAMQAIQFISGTVGNIIGLVYWTIVLVGASKMKSLSSYGFAMTSCIMSMLPCSCCCVLGLPFGIWGLVALNKPGVKDAFS